MTTKKTSRKPAKSKVATVKLNTSMRSMVPFGVQIEGEFVDRTAADEGDIVQIDADAAGRMIAKGRAKKVS